MFRFHPFSGRLLVVEACGSRLRAAVVKKRKRRVSIERVAATEHEDPVLGLAALLGQLGSAAPRKAILLTTEVMPAMVELPLDEDDEISDLEFEEMIRGELEGQLLEVSPLEGGADDDESRWGWCESPQEDRKRGLGKWAACGMMREPRDRWVEIFATHHRQLVRIYPITGCAAAMLPDLMSAPNSVLVEFARETMAVTRLLKGNADSLQLEVFSADGQVEACN